jgi:hypothetical protein
VNSRSKRASKKVSINLAKNISKSSIRKLIIQTFEYIYQKMYNADEFRTALFYRFFTCGE